MDWLESLQDEVLTQFRRPSVSRETKQYANWRLQQHRALFEEVTRENAYEEFLLRELQAAKDRFQLYKRDDEDGTLLEESPYDEYRTRPVCTCDGKYAHRCPLKKGRLPREVREADDIDDGLREFRGNHNGSPTALDDAQSAWAERLGAVEHHFRDLLAILSSDEIPDDVEWPGAEAEDAQPAD